MARSIGSVAESGKHFSQSQRIENIKPQYDRYWLPGGKAQADYLNVPVEGPYKPEHYRY